MFDEGFMTTVSKTTMTLYAIFFRHKGFYTQ